MDWFRHDTNANLDDKLQEVLLDYGLEGYGLYWYCIELIVDRVSAENITFELRHDARVIARNTGSTPQKVEEMMKRFVELGLFENANGTITCLKVAKRLMTSATSNPQMRVLIQNVRNNHLNENNDLELPSRHRHDDIMKDKIREDKIRLEKIKYTPPIPAELLSEWLAVRKKKKAIDLTERSFNAIVKESQLAGITVEQAIEECIVRSWITFKADWYSKPSKAAQREQDLQWFLGNQVPKEIEVK